MDTLKRVSKEAVQDHAGYWKTSQRDTLNL